MWFAAIFLGDKRIYNFVEKRVFKTDASQGNSRTKYEKTYEINKCE